MEVTVSRGGGQGREGGGHSKAWACNLFFWGGAAALVLNAIFLCMQSTRLHISTRLYSVGIQYYRPALANSHPLQSPPAGTRVMHAMGSCNHKLREKHSTLSHKTATLPPTSLLPHPHSKRQNHCSTTQRVYSPEESPHRTRPREAKSINCQTYSVLVAIPAPLPPCLSELFCQRPLLATVASVVVLVCKDMLVPNHFQPAIHPSAKPRPPDAT